MEAVCVGKGGLGRSERVSKGGKVCGNYFVLRCVLCVLYCCHVCRRLEEWVSDELTLDSDEKQTGGEEEKR